ncbi:TetR/AcrR family transcriptional regulator [Liquorilactobacillus mali]|uniref:TetR/AcrR family transcriptional regulator n=1 Tax=Liquorilactobacillus mali TaxID=1618 RepID=UPI00235069C5|nr:TetR/AcrR family transcriptional regulator [Liquorilactobacillus mali]MDC7952235.1 TetR/AcrR family transcriptional regulator [Liquorilactobacillus mali]
MSREYDLRTLKTLSAIENSFMNLIEVKGFRNITINDIAGGAFINRSTFYLHYTDKYNLLDALVDDGISKVIATISPKVHIQDGKLDYNLFSIDLSNSLKVIANQSKLYKFILNDSESLGLRQKTEKVLVKKLSKGFPLKTTVARDLLIEIVSSIYVSVITWWLNNDMKYSSQFMAAELVKFFELGSGSLLPSN